MTLTDAHRQYWHKRKVSDDILDTLGIGYKVKGSWPFFTIPILDFHGKVLFHKLKKAPGGPDIQPKGIVEPSGQGASLYPRPYLHSGIDKIVVCEGEPDCLALLSQGIEAICSTGGAGTFKEEWMGEFPKEIKTVIFAFDRDEAGKKGEEKVRSLMEKHRPDISLKHFHIPKECPGKDITDYLIWKNVRI